MGVEECDLLEGFVKTINILLGCLPFKAFNVLGFGFEQVFKLSHFSSIKVLVLLEFLFQGGDLILDLCLLGLPIFFLSRALVLGLFNPSLQRTNLPGVRLS